MHQKKIAYFLSHPIQYFSPLFHKMSEELDLTVYYYSDISVKGGMDKGFGTTVQWDIPLLNGYKSIFLKNRSKSASMDNRFWDAFNPGVFKALRKDPAKIVIVNGWTYCSSWMVIIFGRLMGKKIWLRAENPMNQELRKSKIVVLFKKVLLGKFLFPLLIHRCLYIGKESKKFFQFYGVGEDKLLYTPYAVDNDAFIKAGSGISSSSLKEQLSIPAGMKIVLFTGKFIPKKRPLDLLQAFHRLNNKDYYLVMVGEGELRKEMEAYVKENELNNVLLTGFVNQQSIPAYYNMADVFVMCSGMGETWGLSVNEAMNFGKPVLVSDTCGCHADLVQEGVNGFVFPEGDTGALFLALKKILENDALRYQMGINSADIIRHFSIAAIVQNIKVELQKSE